MTLGAWRAFARPLAARRGRLAGGALAARGEAGYLLGLAVYRTGLDPGLGRVLTADPVLAFGLLDDGHAVARALAEALEELARQAECRAIHAVVDPVHAAVMGAFEALGHRRETVLLCRRLHPPGSPPDGDGQPPAPARSWRTASGRAEPGKH